MTRRARWYLAIGATRHLLIGIFTLNYAGQFTAAAFIPIVSYAPLWLWGSFMLAAALTCGVSAWLRSAVIARVGLIISATVTLAIGTGITLGVIDVWMRNGTATPITAILLLALACKDYAVCTQPMRSPFEPMLQRFVPVNRADQ